MSTERGNIVYYPPPEARQNRALASPRPELHNFKKELFGTVILIGGLYLIYQGGKNLAEGHYMAGIALVVIGGILTKKGIDMISGKDKKPASPLALAA
ncbi:MAG: hypothetical protein Q8P25_02155 [Candidatus Curtissbacteria bacterium]|nr:hypothetical protein [Candidatus Curtissbacteria bacterium]